MTKGSTVGGVAAEGSAAGGAATAGSAMGSVTAARQRDSQQCSGGQHGRWRHGGWTVPRQVASRQTAAARLSGRGVSARNRRIRYRAHIHQLDFLKKLKKQFANKPKHLIRSLDLSTRLFDEARVKKNKGSNMDHTKTIPVDLDSSCRELSICGLRFSDLP